DYYCYSADSSDNGLF
nr:immunoglobulin light chain junction region [Macaca mulatta]MOW66400.1 immunoglobulin light chain junction region [Macaca mulatta]MOW66692.1 immunoglobulin light chain junction region [Macaca mulatta]MOW67844.1 immunoglobulin light chain junction region [Macaca mulatta]MOW67989.1 immunoglobulin light chain junction region [Macaca mulatta]